jgi:predicted transposase/invertase (TIGR01784 family)
MPIYIYTKDKNMLNEMLEKDVRFRNVERKAARVIEAATGAKFDMKEEEETVDMCQALKEMVADANREGVQKGIEQGSERIARRMLQKGQDSVAYIAEMTGLSEEQVMALKMDL